MSHSRSFLRGSLHSRLALSTMVLFLATGGLLIGMTLLGSKIYDEEVQHRLNREVAAHIASTIDPFTEGALDDKALRSVFMDVMVVNPSLEVYLIDSAGEVLAYDAHEEKILRRRVSLEPIQAFLDGQGNNLVRGDDPRSNSGRKPISVEPIDVDGQRKGYLYIILGGEVFESVTAVLRESHTLRWTAGLTAGGILAAILCATLTIAALTRPLRRLHESVAAYRENGVYKPTPEYGSEEVLSLSRTFESLVERISDQMRQLKDTDRRRRVFVANISHDLRTPTASILGYLETLDKRGESLGEPKRREFIQSAQRQTKRLSRLVDQLFQLAGLEANDVTVDKEAFPLADLAQDATSKFHARAKECGVSIIVECSEELPDVYADIGLIERALDNLIDNALSHSTPGESISVRLVSRAGGVELRVRDQGGGISETDLPHIFDRFYRGSESEGTEGSGLGLAITRRILEKHESDVRVVSTLGKGASFSFVLWSESAQLGPTLAPA